MSMRCVIVADLRLYFCASVRERYNVHEQTCICLVTSEFHLSLCCMFACFHHSALTIVQSAGLALFAGAFGA